MIDSVSPSSPPVATPADLRAQAAAAQQAGDFDRAEALLVQALELAPTDIYTLVARGKLSDVRGNGQQALERFDAAIAAYPRNFWPLLEKGTCLARIASPAQGLAVLLDALALAPQDFYALIAVARGYRTLNNIPEARGHFRAALEVRPDNLNIWLELARLDSAGDPEGALAVLTEAQRNCPDQTQIIRMRMDILIRLRRYAEAEDCLRQVLNSAPDDLEIRLAQAKMFRELGRHADAKVTLSDIADHLDAPKPLRFEIALALGQLHRDDGNLEGALAAFRTAREILPGRVEAHLEIARTCDGLGRTSAATKALAAGLAIAPSHQEALLLKAARLSATNKIKDALEVYATVREHHATAPWGYVAASQLLARHGAAEDALTLLNEARAKCPPSALIELRRAEIHMQRGDIIEAKSVLDAARQRYPTDLWSWVHATSLAIQYGDRSRAEALFATSPVLKGKDRAHLSGLQARFAEMDWDIETAHTHFLEATKLAPDDTLRWMDLARTAMLLGDLEGMYTALKAHAALRQKTAQARGTSANVSQSLLGQMRDEFRLEPDVVNRLKLLGGPDRAEAVRSLTEAVRLYPDSTGAAIGMAVALRRAGAFTGTITRDSDAGGFPKIITQYWNETTPPDDVAGYMRSWQQHNPDHRIARFDQRSGGDYLRVTFGREAGQAFARAPDQARKADILRLGFLLNEGGIYADADDRCLAPIDDTFPAGVDLHLYQEDHGSFGNNILAAKPGHPALRHAFQHAVEATLRGDLELVWLSTGPGLMTRAICHWLAEDAAQTQARLSSLSIVTVQQMRRLAAMHCHAVYKTTSRAWLTSALRKT